VNTYRGALQLLAIVLVLATTLFSTDRVRGAASNHPGAVPAPTIAFIQIGISQNPFWADQARGATEAGRRLGVKVLNLSGDLKISTQIARMNDMINRHVDAIMIIPVDAKAIVPALNRAAKAHIPTLVLYSVDRQATMLSGFDEYDSGHIVGVYAAQYLKKKLGAVKGKLAVLRGILGQSLDAPRTNGFTDVLTKYSGMKVVAEQPTEWQADKAAAIMQDWLVKYPDLTLVYGLSDTITVPAINVAARSPSGRNILFFSIDGDPIGIQAIQQGKMLATALYGPIYAGFHFTVMAYNMIKRYKSGQMQQGTSLLSSALVTQENVAAAVRATQLMSSQIHTFNFNRPLARILALCENASTCGQ
jgi:ABC-type sugar transport system substrate-binding protein